MSTPSPHAPGSGSFVTAAEDLYLRYYPDPVLGVRCHPLGLPDDSARACIGRMFELMYEHQGIGLAAPQVGWNARVFIVNIDVEDRDPASERVFIDPHFSYPSQTPEEGEEGCLSLPGIRLAVDRTPQVNVKATGVDGEQFELETDGILARCIQHENDHLDGILITARVSTLQRIAVDGVLREMREDWQQREEES